MDQHWTLSRRAFMKASVSVAAPVPFSPYLAMAAAPPASLGPLAQTLDNLAKDIGGRLLRGGDPDFAKASAVYNLAAASPPPIAVLEAVSAEDVATGINFARSEGIPLTGMSGGHSYAGYSSTRGLQISFARLNGITVNASQRTATIGPGASLARVAATLFKAGALVPAGSCPTVGVAGHALGGGFGLSGRQFGLLSDNLQSAIAVTADGRARLASATTEPDLFWCLRGGGGGNFALVTQLTFNLQPAADVSVFNIGWPWKRVREVFDAWQRLVPHLPDELTSVATIGSNAPDGDPSGRTCTVIGQFQGSPSRLRQILQPLYRAGGKPVTEDMRESTFLDAFYYFASCRDQRQCQMTPEGLVQASRFRIKSAYARAPFPEPGIDAMIDWVEHWRGNAGFAVLEFDSYGGAINRVAPTATAFVHRNELFVGQYQIYWPSVARAEAVAEARAWLDGLYAAMAPYHSGYAYQNYSNWCDGPTPSGQERALALGCGFP